MAWCPKCGAAHLSTRVQKFKHLTYEQIYNNLDGMTAMHVASITSLKKQKDERGTAFVKRIIATYLLYEQLLDISVLVAPLDRGTA